ncbi:MAG: hypothetical protein HYY20_13155 [Candidatus Tectomicrobia bacterium]|uniref:DNA mismatch repair proteins mutS family domain-containing protein n=1 Tax=Tectimicrobiota bacterium TaxID=2528274 RepID=A0A932CR86_UNCTE|nr:hypothetical protein [Candidatus Tectomicrobia bacterium]
MKDKGIDLHEIQDSHKLSPIPDMFLIDDRGQREEFRAFIKNNPYVNYDKDYYQAHTAFFSDMDLERLFTTYFETDELENPKRHNIKELFYFLPANLEVVRFRQDIVKDFIEDPLLSDVIESSMNTLRKSLAGVNFSSTSKGLLLPYSKLIRDYEAVLVNLIEKLGAKSSEGLKQLSRFLKQMKDHPDMKVWKDYDKKIEEEVPFYLSLTRRFDFTPIAFSIFGFENDSSALSKMLKEATDRFGKIKTDTIDGERLEAMEVNLTYRHQYVRIPLMEAFVQIMMQVFGNPFDGLENHVRYVIASLSQLSFYRKSARLYRQLTAEGIPCIFPDVREAKARGMKIEEAYNFLIERKRGTRLVPNDIENSYKCRINVITGSNYGGKSCYMKTISLVQLMGQIGLYVPARSASLSVVDHIFTHFPEREGAGDIESRYSWELERAKRIFSYATPYSLVLFDEPCSGTAYTEGISQTRTFIKISQQIGMKTYFTTHMHEIAKDIEENRDVYPYCDNLFVVTEQTNQGPRYTYQILKGMANYSGAAQLAEARGCDEVALKKLLDGRILTNSLPVIDDSAYNGGDHSSAVGRYIPGGETG